ncbi:MAG: Uma2 family endonuclease [Oscillatoriales cyanobacterium C42_A2020_001]|nr:Uma2 family endonuclease [Leptolyngbyaceae cyanobacterium C42_A2020_001]
MKKPFGKPPAPSEYRTVLQKVSWQKYEQLLAEMERDRTARFTYQRGRLEMMAPLEEHERCHKLIESLILTLTDELDIRIESYKTPTLKRQDLQLGTEPETAYYIQNAAKMVRRNSIDLETDPVPDLILEVELSRSSLNKFEIYAELGIPEVWRYISKPGDTFLKGQFFIHYLHGDRYIEEDHGLAFPFLSAGRVLQFIDQSDVSGLPTALRELRIWAEETI